MSGAVGGKTLKLKSPPNPGAAAGPLPETTTGRAAAYSENLGRAAAYSENLRYTELRQEFEAYKTKPRGKASRNR